MASEMLMDGGGDASVVSVPNYSYVFKFEKDFEHTSYKPWMQENWSRVRFRVLVGNAGPVYVVFWVLVGNAGPVCVLLPPSIRDIAFYLMEARLKAT